MWTYFLQGLALGFPAAATPGPMHAYFLSQTMKLGWQKTLPSALAPLLSDGPIILLVLLVLTQVPDSFLRLIQIIGGLFILYLAARAFSNLRRNQVGSAEIVEETSQQSLYKATLTNLLNPNPYIYWSLVAGPILLAAWRQSAMHGASFIAGFYGTLVGGFAALILLFSLAAHLAPRLIKAMSVLAIIALLIFGLYQIWTGIVG